jgi:hypothetical protein
MQKYTHYLPTAAQRSPLATSHCSCS